MWKRGGRSSALDRAQALLSAKRNQGGDLVHGSTAQTPVHTGAVGGSVKTRSAPPNTHTLLSDVSELSSVSPGTGHGADTMDMAAAGEILGTEWDSTKDLRPQSSLRGGGSRFLKKAPPPATNSGQSPVRKSQMQQVPEPRHVSSSLRSSQTAALNKLAQIENRIRNRKQAGQIQKPAETLTSDLGTFSPPAAQPLEASQQLSAQSSSDWSLKRKRFLKNNTAVAVDNSSAAAIRSPQSPAVGARSRSRAADAVAPSVGSKTKPVGAVRGVSLESDEEDMRKLLGDSLDSTDNSFLIPARPSPKRAADKLKASSNPAPPLSPGSPSRRSSPFRFTGQAQAHFSPSVLSPSPSPPSVSPSLPGRLNSAQRAGSPQRSLSSMSGPCEVLSLEELFPVVSGSVDPHSEMSAASSEEGQQDFKINVMTLDDLVPATLGLLEETPGEKEEVEEEVVLDYQSDFESESRTEPDYSASQVSEHLQGQEDEEDVVSEVREEASDMSRGRTEDDYSSSFSDTSRSYTSPTSDHSQTLSRCRDSRSSRSPGSHGSQSRRRPSTRKDLKETAVQTQPEPLAYAFPTDMTTLGPSVDVTYMNPTPVAAHTLSAETVEALSAFNPAAFALNELLKQQLAMTRRFIESSRRLHSSLVQSLEPPNYKYTTLEDTKEYIRKHRPPRLTMEEALEEVLQEKRDYHHI
uniref:uncharacterized protein C19orf44 homolog isoform X2 n=1 Tax=Scatophagus argus TaxID=75038 RepID=UPI001ED7D680|nr:uncharacterized protein C19orf44 homolog isoform X2 [Scatophagus argus]